MKKLRYKRVILVGMIFVLFGVLDYMYLHRSRYFEYKGAMTTYIGNISTR